MGLTGAGLKSAVDSAAVTEPERLALTDAQRAVWLDLQRLDDRRVYQVGTSLTIQAEIDVDLARQAVRLIMGRHDALRLRVDRNQPVQWLAKEGGVPFSHLDLSAEADPVRAFSEHRSRVQAAGFDLGDAPLFKVDVFKLGSSDWRLLLICHHLICDGVSIALLQRHLLQAYTTLTGDPLSDDDEGETGAIVLSRSSYLPSIRDDAAYNASARASDDLAYWRDRLTPLPSLVFEDRPRPDGSNPEVKPAVLALDRDAFAAFYTAAGQAQATTHRAFVALLAIALGRRYGQSDFAIGMALHGRDSTNRNVVGMLAGLMPVRCRPDPSATLRTNVERIAGALDVDLRHARLSVDKLGRSLSLAAQGRHALFDVVVTIMPPMGDHGQTTASEPLRTVEITPLALYVRELGPQSGMEIEFSYDDAVLSGAEVDRLRSVLAGVIAAFGSRPNARLSTIVGSSPDERGRIAALSQGDRLPVPASSLADLARRKAVEAPDAPAVVSDETTLTAAELDRAATRVAARLLEQGIRPGEVVGVAMPRSAVSVVAILGILKAGGVYLPLDPAYPDARLAGMVEDAGARVVLVREASAEPSFTALPTLALDDAWVFGADDPQPALPEVSPESVAYIVYTSGSTGRPKGVAVSHAAAVNLAFARQVHDPIGPGDRVLAAISIGFDVSIGQLLLPLMSGATIVVAGDVRGQSPQAFWDFMVRHAVSHVNSVPSFFEAMLPGVPDRHALKQLMLGGEPLSGSLAERLMQRFGGVRIVNMYGPTEACIDASAYIVPPSGTAQWPVLPIGRPLPNYTFHILNDRLESAGIGAIGELHIGGAGLAEGYVGQPELTQERFVAHPQHGRLYRTGDRAAWREDGRVGFFGRADNQVKVRGHRIELGEIEGVLLTHPAVAQAAVIARPSPRGDQSLLAYVVSHSGQEPAIDEIDAHLARVLPSHMMPAFYRLIDAIPLTRNGKIDHQALPQPDESGRAAGTPPQTATELWLAGHFAALLGAEGVTLEDSFFALGGHSLLATQLAARVRDELQVELPIRILFEAPRLGDLARRIDALRSGDTGGAPAIIAGPRPTSVPLSFPQERIWFVDRLQQDASYNIPVALDLAGALDTGAVAQALEEIVRRHEALRTRILVEDGRPIQIVDALDRLALPTTEATEAELPGLLAKLAAHRFDLEAGWPFAFRLIALAPERHVLSLVMHHTAFDGWSASVFHREFVALYQAFSRQQPSPLPPLAIQYPDFALWQRGQDRDADLRYWLDELKDAPPRSELPGRDLLAGEFARVPGSVPIRCGEALSADLARLSRDHNASLFMVLHAAFALLLGRWNGQDDIVIGTVVANRRHAEFEAMLGCFVNTVPLRTRFRAGESFGDLLARVTDGDLSAFAHQDLPFEQLFAALGLDRSMRHTPVFQTMFILQNTPPVSLDWSGLTVTPLDGAPHLAKFDLMLTLEEGRDGLAGAFEFAANRFDPALVERFADQFRRLLAAVAADPLRDLSTIDLISDEERSRILTVWNRPIVAFPEGTLDGMFEAQARSTPDALAIVDRDGREITYAALDARATALARHLVERGVGPERVVGVRMERSAATIVAMLGILKAGGAYLPLDPAYPQDRLDYMAADAGAVLVLDTVQGLSGDDLSGEAELHPSDETGRLAYIIYTSGTTGRPKGVAVAHRSAVNLLHARSASYDPLEPGDRVLAVTSVSFDMSIEQMLFPLLRGATVVVADDVRTLGGDGFWDLVSRRGVTHIDFVPSFLESILSSARTAGPLALKRLMLGGEAVSGAFLSRIRQEMPGLEVVNVYGPTETTIDATFHVATAADIAAGVLPIGRPLPNYTAYVLDANRHLLGAGLEGELYVGGEGLARGYVNAPDLTADKFIESFAGRLYRTGDRARWREDGSIEFLGRKDEQVKIRGFRVELGEIAAALMEHPDVDKAVVVSRTSQGQTRLVAFIVGAGRPSELKAHAARRLPDHMVPSAYVPIEAVPLNGNGKLNLSALPADLDQAEERTYHPPEGPRECALQPIWEAVLGLSPVGRDENFFDLGGQSLMAIRLIHQINLHFDVKLPMRALFERPTIAGLAAELGRGSDDVAAHTLVPLRTGGGRPPLFCIHPGGGHVFCYFPLTRALGAEQPVFGVQARGLDDAEPLPSSIEQMAADYIRPVVAAQPDGPIHLLGMSLGGLIAFELARQLKDLGREVAHLTMMDTTIPEDITGVMSDTLLLATLAAEFGLGDLVDGLVTNVQQLVDRAVAAGRLPPGFTAERAERIAAVFANMAEIQMSYRPRPLDVPTLSIRALQRMSRTDHPPDWSRYVEGPLATVDLDCGHNDLISDRLAPAVASAVLLHGARPAGPTDTCGH